MMICEHCHIKQATVHMQQFVNGEKSEIHLCADCAGAQADIQLSFDNFFQGFLDSFLTQYMKGGTAQTPDAQIMQCAGCGLSYPQFKSIGRLGCAQCYDTFRTEMSAIFKNVQGGIVHQGKYPQKSGASLKRQRRIENLKAALSRAIESEAYEEAARLRDDIRALQRSECDE